MTHHFSYLLDETNDLSTHVSYQWNFVSKLKRVEHVSQTVVLLKRFKIIFVWVLECNICTYNIYNWSSPLRVIYVHVIYEIQCVVTHLDKKKLLSYHASFFWICFLTQNNLSLYIFSIIHIFDFLDEINNLSLHT